MSAKISKYLCQNLFIGAAAQIRAVYKDHEILITLKRVLTKTFFAYLRTAQVRARLLI